MANATTTANLVREFVAGLRNCADSNVTPLLNLATRVDVVSDSSYRWLLKYADNASTTTFTEGQAASAAGSVSYAKPLLAYSGGFRRTMVQVTGHARDYNKNGYEDAVMMELESGFERHMKAIEAAGCTALEAAIDADGTVYGLTRASTNTASYEASIGTPALPDLSTMWNTLASGTIGMDMTRARILSQIGVLQTYVNTMTPAANRPLNYTAGGAIEGSNTAGGVTFNRRPWDIIPDMTSTVLLMIDPAYLKRVVLRDVTVEEYAKTDDSQTWALTSAEILVYENPRYAGKLTDI
jgi:hypothetical protein